MVDLMFCLRPPALIVSMAVKVLLTMKEDHAEICCETPSDPADPVLPI
jgi:hypothetical protein